MATAIEQMVGAGWNDLDMGSASAFGPYSYEKPRPGDLQEIARNEARITAERALGRSKQQLDDEFAAANNLYHSIYAQTYHRIVTQDVTDLLSIKEVAILLRIRPQRVSELIARGKLAGVQRDGERGHPRIPRWAVDAYLASGRR